jgi:long-chain acyl-CoA synthetase
MGSAFENVYSMFESTVDAHAEEPCYFERVEGRWQPTTWRQLKEQADRFAMALLASGLRRGDTLSILSANRLLWPIADIGTIAAGGISVGIYPTSSAEQCEYLLGHSGSRWVVVDSPEQLTKIEKVRARLPDLQAVILGPGMPEPPSADPGLLPWSRFLARADQYRADQGWESYQRLAHASSHEDPVIVVYTSGTTGNPKGAVFSNRYVIASAAALGHLMDETRESFDPEVIARLQGQPLVTMSFLPFCHVAERISGMYARMHWGYAAYLVDDLTQLYANLLEANPHSFGGVPRFFEKVYAKVMNEVETGRGYRKDELEEAVRARRQAKELRARGEALPAELCARLARAEEQVARKVRSNFVNRILTLSSGAAPIPPEVLDMFEYAGNIPILEAYGLTELICCCFNTPRAHRANSVGRPMLGCQVRIAEEDGEILLRGPQMFSGYYKDEAATREVIDADGWLYTGDIGRLDEDGFLFITGRKKEFIKTSTGKKIAPLGIENLCKRNHLISNVMVCGDNRNYLTALITLNALELQAYAAALALPDREVAALSKNPAIHQLLQKTVDEVNRQVSRTEQIKRFTVLEQDFSVERYEITPTGKVKRNVVAERYREQIDAMYRN